MDGDDSAAAPVVVEKISAIPKKVKTTDTRPASAIVEDCIHKVSQYRAGGDGGNCLKILIAYVGNVYEKGTEEKFRSINTENKAYKSRVKPFIGAKKCLEAIGFEYIEDEEKLTMKENEDRDLIKQTLEKLKEALVKYGPI